MIKGNNIVMTSNITYHKTPIFFQNNSTNNYVYDFNSNQWKSVSSRLTSSFRNISEQLSSRMDRFSSPEASGTDKRSASLFISKMNLF